MVLQSDSEATMALAGGDQWMKCRKCSYDNDDLSRYCAKCGEKLDDPDPITLFKPSAPPVRERSESGRLIKLAAIAVVLVVIISVIIVSVEWQVADHTKFRIQITVDNVSNPMHYLPEVRIAVDLDNDGQNDESRYYRVTSQSNGTTFHQVGALTDYFEVVGKGRSFSYTVHVFCNGTTLFYNSARTIVQNQGTVDLGSSGYWKFDDYHDLYWCTMETGYEITSGGA